MASLTLRSVSSARLFPFLAVTRHLCRTFTDQDSRSSGTSNPSECDQEDGTCDDITRELTFKPITTFDKENHYRYILDIDGNAWSARFKRLLNSNALILKSTIYPEWWNDRIQPWVHYVPVKVDYEDIYDIMAFVSLPLHPNHASAITRC